MTKLINYNLFSPYWLQGEFSLINFLVEVKLLLIAILENDEIRTCPFILVHLIKSSLTKGGFRVRPVESSNFTPLTLIRQKIPSTELPRNLQTKSNKIK